MTTINSVATGSETLSAPDTCPQASSAIIANRVRLARSAFCQSKRGTSGKEPKPSPATCSFLNFATRQNAACRACGQRPERGFRRTPRRHVGRLGWICKTVSGFRPVQPSIAFLLCKWPAVAVAGRGRFLPILLGLPSGRLASKSTYSPARRQCEWLDRKCGNGGMRQASWGRAFCSTSTCNFGSSIFGGYENPATPYRIRHTLVEA